MLIMLHFDFYRARQHAQHAERDIILPIPVRPSVSPSIQMYNETRICAAEMAVRYAALSACRKVRMPSARAEKYMCVIVIR